MTRNIENLTPDIRTEYSLWKDPKTRNQSPNEVKSYRPISLLSTISKVLLILKTMQSIIETKQLIPKYQFGFRL